MIADQHPLLEERGIGTRVGELPAQCIAHVVQLAASVHVGIVSRRTSLAREVGLHVGRANCALALVFWWSTKESE